MVCLFCSCRIILFSSTSQFLSLEVNNGRKFNCKWDLIPTGLQSVPLGLSLSIPYWKLERCKLGKVK